MTTLPNFLTTDWTRISTRDHSGDGVGDILWHNGGSAANLLWSMSGATVAATTELPTLPAGYATSVVGDFDGDGVADVLLRNDSNGGNRILLSGNDFATPAVLGNVPTAFDARAATDANGDGNADLFWFNTNSAGITVYAMNGNSVIGVGSVASTYATDDLLHATFNGTALDSFDSLWFDTSASTYHIASYDLGIRNVTGSFTVASAKTYESTGDYNGDGGQDFLFVDRVGVGFGDAELVFTSDFDDIGRIFWDASDFNGTQVAAGGDFDGDGQDELLLRNGVSGDTQVVNPIGGSDSSTTIFGSDGVDLIDGRAGNDRIFGLQGDDFLLGGENNDTMDGGAGNDTMEGNVGDDMLIGGAGDDFLEGESGNDVLLGGAGNDLLSTGSDYDIAHGGAGDDHLLGSSSSGSFDHLKGGLGDDRLMSVGGRSIQEGGSGDDYLSGGSSLDRLFGDSGDDVLIGGLSIDYLDGGSGNDVLVGVDLGGTSGQSDTMTGGTGRDFFVLGNQDAAYYAGTGRARIEDFSASNDYILLHGLSSEYDFVQDGSTVDIRFDGTTNLVAEVLNATVANVTANAIYM